MSVRVTARFSPGPEIQQMAPYAYGCFRALIAAGTAPEKQDLGGTLLYAGELDEEGRAIVIGGNVAGCGTLSIAADPAAQKRAIHDGIVDFLVTSLDEALRILKNEIRKHATVAVCVGKAADDVEREMQERGVQPDITRESVRSHLLQQTAKSRSVRVFWMLESAPLAALPKIDAIAQECLDRADTWNARWIRLAPRYLRRVAPNTRVVDADREFADRFMQRARSAYQAREIPVMPSIQIFGSSPAEDPQALFGGITPQRQ
jgi:hypothetical protein